MYTQLRNLNEETSKISQIVRQERRDKEKLSFPFVLAMSTSPSHNVKLIVQELSRVEPLIRTSQRYFVQFKRNLISDGRGDVASQKQQSLTTEGTF